MTLVSWFLISSSETFFPLYKMYQWFQLSNFLYLGPLSSGSPRRNNVEISLKKEGVDFKTDTMMKRFSDTKEDMLAIQKK